MNGRRCSCGRIHANSSRIEIGSGVLAKLGDVIREVISGAGAGFTCANALLNSGDATGADGNPVAGTGGLTAIRDVPITVIGDINTFGVAGDAVIDGLHQLGSLVRVSKVVLEPDCNSNEAIVEPDSLQVFRILEAVQAQWGILVSVGSGSVTDLTRWVANKCGLSHVAVATAASMDGYTSSVSPLLHRGFKRTYPAKVPIAVLADTGILARAPQRMTAAGWGDLVGKYTANSDWLVAHLAFGEYRCAACWEMLEVALKACRGREDGLASGDPDVIEALIRGLVDSGIAISYAGLSRPASGGEHLLAHCWEMMGLMRGCKVGLHGELVGVGTTIVSQLYERIFALDWTTMDMSEMRRDHDKSEYQTSALNCQDRLERSIGHSAAAEAIRETGHTDRSWEARQTRLTALVENRDEIESAVRSILPPLADIKHMLAAAGTPYEPAHLDIPREWVRDALFVARHIRNRYTVLNLAADLGLLDEFSMSV